MPAKLNGMEWGRHLIMKPEGCFCFFCQNLRKDEDSKVVWKNKIFQNFQLIWTRVQIFDRFGLGFRPKKVEFVQVMAIYS